MTSTKTGKDGFTISYPSSGYTYKEGRDGHIVAFPTGSRTNEDESGRKKLKMKSNRCQILPTNTI